MFTHTKILVDKLLQDKEVSNIAISIGRNNSVLGEIYSNGVNDKTLFDMASVTKILSVTAISLILIDKGLLDYNEKISAFFEVPPHYEELRVYHLLTHTMGIGHKDLTKNGNTYDDIAEHILSIYDKAPGSDVDYSCPAIILLGKILEKICGKRLDALFSEMVAKPLKMERSGFLPDRSEANLIDSNLLAENRGIVHDYNCRYLGGVAGNAGVFSCVQDLTQFVGAMLRDGDPLFSKETMDIASKNHTEGMSAARGLGFVYVDERYKRTGQLFPVGSIGHGGYTGTSVFWNRETGLYAIILSDATVSIARKYGKERPSQMRLVIENIHNAIKKDLDL